MDSHKFTTRPADQQSMLGYRCTPIETVHIGFVGVGARGQRAVERMMNIEGAKVVALCDFMKDNLEISSAIVAKYGEEKPSTYFGTADWQTLCSRDDVDLVYISTDWLSHADIAIYAMEHGKHVALEVPAAMSVKDCWRLVDTAERTQRHCMMLENCCYDEFELATLNMVQQGLFGEIIHAEASYIHDLRKRISLNDNGHRLWKNWQVEYMATHIANFYPTHGLGPVALALGIHRGDRMKSIVSVSSKAIGQADEFRGTMNSSIITTEKGHTILLQHCIALPRPYSRSFLLSGTDGYIQKYPTPYVTFASNTADVLSGKQCTALTKEYRHPFIAEYKEKGMEICGSRWIDFVMDSRLIYCLRNGLPLDMDVYDAAEWSSLVELTEQSALSGGTPVEIPDFTRGEWDRLSSVEFAMAK
ncbi:MAG: Gfo/Idh/MocA family oxidoreductase [Rikenellaceae bacterium]|nr:Gfo/Idh/MocA family oxidoreductase [Rikenellaceae bacterium]